MREILSDLVAEQQALDQFLQQVHERQWNLPTAAPGWSIHDTVSHLAYTETFAASAIEKGQTFVDSEKVNDIDEWASRGPKEGKGKRYQEVIEWWRNGRAAVVDALSRMESTDRIAWVIRPMGAKAFATMRLMETWAHGLDIRAAMEGRLPEPEEGEEETNGDSPRLRHVAWMAHRMLPYAFGDAGEEFPTSGIRVELMGPNYARYVYGPGDADAKITGIASEFCRVAVHRLDVGETGLKAVGDDAEMALKLLRTY